MSGFLTEGLPSLATFTGSEEFYSDSQLAAGNQPQTEKIALYKLAMMMYTMMNSLSKTPVAGSIYYSQFNIGFVYTPTPRGAVISEQSFAATGVNVPVGSDWWD